MIDTVVFPVAGFGTRLLPLTKSTPKEMLPIFNKPLIHYVFEEAKNAGIKNFIFITSKSKDSIVNYFDRHLRLEDALRKQNKTLEIELLSELVSPSDSVSFVRQGYQGGLGDAIGCAKAVVGDKPFAVILPDEIMMEEKSGALLGSMIDVFNQHQAKINVISVAPVAEELISSYGIVKADSNNRITDMVEKPKKNQIDSNLSISGRYIFLPEIFNHIAKLKCEGEKQITDAMKNFMSESPFYCVRYAGKRFDCGGLEGLFEANLAYALKNEKSSPKIREIISRYR